MASCNRQELEKWITGFLGDLRFRPGKIGEESSTDFEVVYGEHHVLLGSAAKDALDELLAKILRHGGLGVKLGTAYVAQVIWDAVSKAKPAPNSPDTATAVGKAANHAVSRLLEERIDWRLFLPLRGLSVFEELRVGKVWFLRPTPRPDSMTGPLSLYLQQRRSNLGDEAADATRADLDRVFGAETVGVAQVDVAAPEEWHARRMACAALDRACALISVASRWGGTPNVVVPARYLGIRSPEWLSVPVSGPDFSVLKKMINWDPPCLLSSDTVSSMREFGLDRLCRDQDGLSELESAMFTACYWMWQGMTANTTAQRVVNFVIAMESMLSAPSERGGITNRLRERVAWLLGSGPESCLRVEGDVAYLYGRRSSTVHAGETGVPDIDANYAERMASAVLRRMLKLTATAEVRTWSDLAKHFHRRKYATVPDQDLR